MADLVVTSRHHEARARAIIDLSATLIDRARASDRETVERAEFLGLVAQVEAVARFEIVEDQEAVLDDFFARANDLALRVGVEPVRTEDVQAKISEMNDDHARGLAMMRAAVFRLRGGVATECGDLTAPLGCSRGPSVAGVHDCPPASCRYSGIYCRCRGTHVPEVVREVEGITPGEAARVIPHRMMGPPETDPLDPRVRRRRGQDDHRRTRAEDKRVEAVLVRQAEAARETTC